MNPNFRVLAILCAHNEADILAESIDYLIAQGIEVHYMDHGSTDGSLAIAQERLGQGVVCVERFPQDSGYPAELEKAYHWGAILKRKQEIAHQASHDWCLHVDADEFREGPWPDLNLHESLERVDSEGYNAVNFEVIDYVMTLEDLSHGTVQERMLYHNTRSWYTAPHLKAWKNNGPVDLASSGGHEAKFAQRKAYPVRFLLRHYPLRGIEHAQRKVAQERKARFVQAELDLHWHGQYQNLKDEAQKWVQDPTRGHLDQRHWSLLQQQIWQEGQERWNLYQRLQFEDQGMEFSPIAARQLLIELGGPRVHPQEIQGVLIKMLQTAGAAMQKGAQVTEWAENELELARYCIDLLDLGANVHQDAHTGKLMARLRKKFAPQST
jgi:hypothetical protein